MAEFFLSNSTFGNLIIKDVLVTYDYPRVFICENQLGHKYLFSTSDSGDEFDEWVIVGLSDQKYYSLLTNRLDLRSALTNSEDGNYYIFRREYTPFKEEINQSSTPLIEKITPYSDCFVGFKDNSDIETHDILAESKRLDTSMIDFVLYSGNKSIRGIPLEYFSTVSTSLYPILQSNTRSRFLLRSASTGGSFVIRLIADDPTNLFVKSESEDAIKKVQYIFSTSDINNIFAKLSGNQDMLSEYQKALLALRQIKTNIQLISAFPEADFPLITNITSEFIEKSLSNISDFEKMEKQEISLVGFLNSFDKKNKKFSFVTEEGKLISGKYAESAYPDGFEYTIDKKYSCKLCYSFLQNPKGEKTKETYLLVSSEKI
jgi:hypothetical protein